VIRVATWRELRKRDQAGYAAVVTALLASVLFLGMAAFGVDTARWYTEIARVQKAADAAALAGVTYMPNDLTNARATAIAVATKNGYPNSGTSRVTVGVGSRPSELKVTITSTINNTFGTFIGVDKAKIVRSAVADYTAPSLMGSPCNIFGNEPPSTSTTVLPTGTALPASPFPNCNSTPQFWATVEGPATDKVNGDRYGNRTCSTSSPVPINCSGSTNSEYKEEGYFFAIHVEPGAVGTKLDIQLYDPAFVETGKNCESLPTANAWDRMNQYTLTDGISRYKPGTTSTPPTPATFCNGDFLGSGTAPTTTYLIREPVDNGDPRASPVVAGCTKQFRGTLTPPTTALHQWTTATGTTKQTAYNPELTRVFHQWVSLCDNGGFTPTQAGDYYMQVRTNVTFGGTVIPNVNPSGTSLTTLVSKDNPAASAATGNAPTGTAGGVGNNSFAIRAVPTDSSKKSLVAVAGFYRMPIFQNADGATATFNLIRALPATKGQYIAFDFYDVADCTSTCQGTVKVTKPAEATGSFTSGANFLPCRQALNGAALTTATNCQVTVKNSTHNGQLQHMVVPIPPDYTCNPATLGGCWFSVTVTFTTGGSLSDITTWDANIGGDPVRLIK
jgi:Flp pilus assembly protein TadG